MNIRKSAVAVVCAFVVAAVAVSAQSKLEEKVVGRSAARTEAYMVSPGGVHYAVLTPKGARNVIVFDGVEGPPFDSFLTRRGHPGTAANNGVVFSPDGARHAYFAAAGNQYILVVDGKEMARGALGPSNLGYIDLQFSPGGKHVFFMDLQPSADGRARAQIVMDGKPGPAAANQNILPVFSPDDLRWAYNAAKFGGRADEFISVVDGREVPFVGYNPFFTGDNKLIASLQKSAYDPAVLTIDGKPAANGISAGGKIAAAPVGPHWAGVVQPKKPGEPNTLAIDGKPVPEAQNVEEVVFSPNGRRYMAICSNPKTRAKYVVIDGRKGPEYQSLVQNLYRFTPDSSKAIYVANNTGKNFVAVDGVPSPGFSFLVGQSIVTSQKGGHYAYIFSDGGAQSLIVDGRSIPLNGRFIVQDSLGFSPDGSRYAYLVSKPGPGARRSLVVDGTEYADILLNDLSISQMMRNWWVAQWGVQSKYYMFSDDGKHIAFTGARANETKYSVYVDGKAIFALPVSKLVSFLSWTPDGNHVLWISDEKLGQQQSMSVVVDGKPSPLKFSGDQPAYPGVWQIGTDGVLQFLVFEGQATKRFRLTPSN